MEETKKFLDASFIKEIQYPTKLSNVVLVYKPNEKWKMCVGHYWSQRSCPEDPYLLPNIDRLINGVAAYKTPTFMDAY